MAKRRYSDEERAAALAALAANRGNVSRTARQAGVARKTLEHWAKGRFHPEAAKNGQLKKPELADRFQELAEKMVGVSLRKAGKLNAKDAAVAAGIAVDKMRLLREQSTANFAHSFDLTKLDDDQLTILEQLSIAAAIGN